MTIERGFLEQWKFLCPQAFTPFVPFVPDNAFIDGQLKLMRPSGITSWDTFLQIQFVQPINRLFELGAQVVTLGFDNYRLVPLSKAPTQRMRTKKIRCVPWNADSELPPSIPEHYEVIIFNRVFKSKVCHFVASNVADRVQLGNGRRLVIDWNNLPLEFTAEEDEPRPRGGFQCVGECDCKWVQHLEPGRNMAVESIDGDYCAIAMLQLENRRKQYTVSNNAHLVPRIAIRRLRLKLTGAGSEAINNRNSNKYEWVDCNLLLEAIAKHVQDKCTIPAQFAGREFELMAYVVALTGCDFVEGINGVGPKTMWKWLPTMLTNLAQAYDEHRGEFDSSGVANAVVLPVLHSMYSKQVRLRPKTLAELLHEVHATAGTHALTSRQKSRMPSASTVICAIRNANWTLLYWKDCPSAPDPVQKVYGFRRVQNKVERDVHASL